MLHYVTVTKVQRAHYYFPQKCLIYSSGQIKEKKIPTVKKKTRKRKKHIERVNEFCKVAGYKNERPVPANYKILMEEI